MGAADALGRLPRARPVPRAVPNAPIGAELAEGAEAGAGSDAERGSLGAAAGAPDDAVSDMLFCLFMAKALNARREQPDGW